MPENKSKNNKDKSNISVKSLIIPSVAMSVMFFVFLAVGALLFLNNGTSSSAYLPFSIVAGGICGFISGFVSVRIIKNKGLFYGAVSGIIQSLIVSIVIFLMNKGIAGNGIFILIGVTVALSALGGVAAVNLKKKIKY